MIYTRDGCCLCDDALEVLERVRTSRPFELERTDIGSDERLLTAYLERIPVVTIDGVEAFEFFVDEDAFIDWLGRGDPSRRETAAEVE